MKTPIILAAFALAVLFLQVSVSSSSPVPASHIVMIDSNVTAREEMSEQNYFIANSILDSGLTEEQLADSLLPHTKWLTLKHRELLYKEHSRFTMPTYDGPFGPTIPVPFVAPFIQGDALGMGLMLGGIGLFYAAAVGNPSLSLTNILFYSGVGALIGSHIRASSVNVARIEFNKALAGVLRVPVNFSYQFTPTLQQLPDGSVAPALSMVVGF